MAQFRYWRARNEPQFKYRPFSAVIDGELNIWGGKVKKTTTTLKVYNPFLKEWKRVSIEGQPPPGLYLGASAHSDHFLYAYGGVKDDSSYSGCLHRLDKKSTWVQLAAHSADAPMKKMGCGMIVYENSVIIIGGFGVRNGPIQSFSEWFKGKGQDSNSAKGWTNEMHKYDLIEGTWSSIAYTGRAPPAYSNFSLNMIDDHRAILFGGLRGGDLSSNAYMLDLKTMHWSKIPQRDGDILAPRADHAAVCIDYGSSEPQLLVTGGYDVDHKVLNDLWILDILSGKWNKVPVPSLQCRYGHCAGPFSLSPKITEVVLFGGSTAWPPDDSNTIANTCVLRFELQDNSSGGKSWVLTDVAGEAQLSLPEMLTERMKFSSFNKNEANPDLRLLQQKLEESKRRAEESNKRAEQLQKEIEELQKKAMELRKRAEESQKKAEESDRRAEELQQSAVFLQRRIEGIDKSKTDDEVLDKEGFLSVGEATATYTGKSTDIKNDELGIQVHIPDQDLPPDVTKCSVSVSVAVSGEFDLPEKSELVSGVYKIDSSFVPQKPITIMIQHCAAEDGIGNLSFASSTDTSPPFAYKCINRGKFTSTHGEIEINEFCYYTILEKHGTEGLLSLYQKKYQLSLHCSKNPTIERPSCLSWNLFFTMVKDCAIFQRSVNRYFEECDAGVERLADVVVKFKKESQDVVLALEGDRVEVQQGWSVISLVTCCIQKNEVDNYADGRPPQFHLILMQSRDDNPSDLLHKFKLKGVEDSECFINIFKPVSSSEGIIMGPSHKIQYERYLKEINESNKSALELEITNDGHLCQIADVLQNWQEKFYLLDLKLNPDVHDIHHKHRDNPVLERHEVLSLWREKSMDPTYNNLLKICAQAGWKDSARVIITIINKLGLLE